MKTISKLFLALTFIAITLTSCNKDDDNSIGSVVGKWEYSQEGLSANGQEVLVPYEHTAGCSKDYTEFKSTGVIDEVQYFSNENNVCTPSTNSGTYTQNGSAITITSNGVSATGEIVTLNATTLKTRATIDGITYVTVYTKAAN